MWAYATVVPWKLFRAFELDVTLLLGMTAEEWPKCGGDRRSHRCELYIRNAARRSGTHVGNRAVTDVGTRIPV